jgi:hypothetical protein
MEKKIETIRRNIEREMKGLTEGFYASLGRTIEEWLLSLQCPKCRARSRLDWVLRKNSKEPAMICLNCDTVYPIPGVTYKKEGAR